MESSDSESRSNSPDLRKTSAETLNNKKAKLRKDIKELKELNFQIESSMHISKFGDIRHLLQTPEPDAQSRNTKRIIDVESEYTDELFKLAGMRCTKFVEDEYIFNFYGSENFFGNDSYAVQITDVSGKPIIGKWVMPMSVDMSKIISQTPLNNAMELKPFLANCKHHIDCYNNRVQQYLQLQAVVEDLSGCWLDSRLGHTVITLKFFDVRDLDSEELYDIILYLIYESNRVRPHKMKFDGLNRKILSDVAINKLKAHFKSFKCYDLKKAFEKALDEEDSQIIWKNREDQDSLNLSDSSASSSVENSLAKKSKNKSKPSRRGSKRKVKETSWRSQESENETQRSDESDARHKADDPEPSLPNPVSQKDKKSSRKKGKAQAPKNKKIRAADPSSAAGVSKKKSKAKKNPQKNVEPNKSGTNTNLRQSTLGFTEGSTQFRRPLSEKLPPAGTSSVKQIKSSSNSTLVVNREFGTSTPVSKVQRQKKRFAVDYGTEVSPIKKDKNVTLKRKQPSKKS